VFDTCVGHILDTTRLHERSVHAMQVTNNKKKSGENTDIEDVSFGYTLIQNPKNIGKSL